MLHETCDLSAKDVTDGFAHHTQGKSVASVSHDKLRPGIVIADQLFAAEQEPGVRWCETANLHHPRGAVHERRRHFTCGDEDDAWVTTFSGGRKECRVSHVLGLKASIVPAGLQQRLEVVENQQTPAGPHQFDKHFRPGRVTFGRNPPMIGQKNRSRRPTNR